MSGHTERIKKLAGTIFIVALLIYAVVDLIFNFVADKGLDYFSEQPLRLLFVAIIAIVGGFIQLGFSALPRRLQRGIKLVLLGLGASFVMSAGGYLSFQVFKLSASFESAIPRRIPWLLAFGTITVAGLLWFGFYRVLRNNGRVVQSREQAT